VSDKKLGITTSSNGFIAYTAEVISASNQYPYGSPMPGKEWHTEAYRFGMNTQEKDDEIAGFGNHYTAQYWEYDPRVVMRWNLDPKQIIGISPRVINGNNPIYYTDPNGDFRTKFGANVYKFFFGGEVRRATGGERAGEYFVEKQAEYTGEGAGVAYQRTFDSKISSIAEYLRGGLGAVANFHEFLIGGGGNQTYKEGSFEADEMASSPGVQKGIEELKKQLDKGNTSAEFYYEFSPNPMTVLKKTLETGNPLNGFSKENKEAHVDAFKDQSWTKLFVGGYGGAKISLIDANTVRIVIENKTTANSLLLHGGELIFGKENGANRFNNLWNKTYFLNTLNQRFEFTVPLKK
jgi:hypothetical protein